MANETSLYNFKFKMTNITVIYNDFFYDVCMLENEMFGKK